MTITLPPSDDDRPVPRVVNLAARGGLREGHWRNVRRRLDPHDVTPFVPDLRLSRLDRWVLWWDQFPDEDLLVIAVGIIAVVFVAGLINVSVQ